MRRYELLKVWWDDEPVIAVVSRDLQDDEMWAVIRMFPASKTGRFEAREYVREVEARQQDLAGGK